MAVAKIPDMFFRALKRKQEKMNVAIAESTKMGAGVNEKRARNEHTVESENAPPSADAEEPTLASSCKEVAELEDAKEKIFHNECGTSQDTVGVSTPQLLTPADLVDDGSLLSLVRDQDWREILKQEFAKKYVKEIEQFLEKERTKGATVFPPRDEIFSALQLTPLNQARVLPHVKVVLIGQDPYHNDGQAHGLCFSVKKGVPPPPSLKNIYKELAADLPGFKAPDHGFLEGWARQGILMLNAALTVRAHEANSHSKIGWYTLTDRIISVVNKEKEGVVFLLWGGFAHKKASLVDAKRHAIVQVAHPSPLSARHFMGCRCFSKVNDHLERFGKTPIDWADL